MKNSITLPHWKKGLKKVFNFQKVAFFDQEDQEKEELQKEASAFLEMLTERWGTDFVEMADSLGSNEKFLGFLEEQITLENHKAHADPDKARDYALRSQGVALVGNVFRQVGRYREVVEKGCVEVAQN